MTTLPPEDQGALSADTKIPGDASQPPQSRPVFEATDVTYLMAVKPFLTPRAQSVIELIVNMFGKAGEAMNPATLLSMMSALAPLGSGQRHQESPAGIPGMGSLGNNLNPILALMSMLSSQTGGNK